MRAIVDETLAAIGRLIATATLTVNEDGATVLVDGELAGKTPLAAPVVVDLGRPTLIVKKPGFETVESAIYASGGTASTYAVTLRTMRHVGRLVVTTDSSATVAIDDR